MLEHNDIVRIIIPNINSSFPTIACWYVRILKTITINYSQGIIFVSRCLEMFRVLDRTVLPDLFHIQQLSWGHSISLNDGKCINIRCLRAPPRSLQEKCWLLEQKSNGESVVQKETPTDVTETEMMRKTIVSKRPFNLQWWCMCSKRNS